MRSKIQFSKKRSRLNSIFLAAVSAAAAASHAQGQALSLPTFNSSNVFNVTTANSSIHGGVPASTGSSDNSAALNAYISFVSSLPGGGTVEIPAGTFKSGTITLRSNVNLQVDGGAVLANANSANTLIQTTGSSTSNFAISGSGIIDGGATTVVGGNKLITLTHGSTMAITGVSIENAANEHLVLEQDSNVTVSNVTIADPGTLAANSNNYLSNTDGIDYSGSNFTIKNCNINDGDDDIVAKTANAACSNILITNNTIGAGHGISVGGGTQFGLRNMTVSNITFNGTSTALRLKAEDATLDQGGGTAAPVVNVLYSNIVMTNVSDPLVIDSFYNGGNNFPSSPTQANHAVDATTPMFENIGFSNVTINTTSAGGLFYDLNTTPSNLQGLSFNNVNITSGSAMQLWWGTNINLSGLTVNRAVDQENLTNVTQAGPVSITWNNTGASVAATSLGDGATWDIVANQNWNTGTSFTTYTNSSNVTFNDANNGHYNVMLNSAVSPLSTSINNSVAPYTISGIGTIAGSGSLTKAGTGTATISTSNAYTGGTTINGGTLTVGSVNALGALATFGTGSGTKPGGTAVNASGSLDLNGLSLAEPITLNGGILTNSSAAAAGVIGGVKGVGYTTTGTGIGGSSTITFNSGTATAVPIFGITSASFSGFTGTYPVPTGKTSPPPQAPNVLITPSDGNGSGALAIAVLTGTTLTGVTIINPGSGYDAPPIISFIGGNSAIPGTATGNANNFTLVGIQTTNAGSGYGSTPTATFHNVGGSGAVTLSPVIGSITLASTSSIGGSAGDIALPLTVTGAGGLTKIGSDTVTLGGNAGYAGATQINQGTLAVDVNGSIPSSVLNVNAGGTLRFNAQSGGTTPLVRTVAGINLNGGSVVVSPAVSTDNSNRSVLVTQSLSVTAGKLDLTSNDLVIKGATPAAVQSLLQSGFNAGSGYWNGSTGIVSSTVANDTSFLTTLGYAVGGSPFDGVTTSASDVLVKYTYYGDANLDGIVDGADYQQIDLGFGTGATSWSDGDFNYDGVVNGSDFSLIDNAFNQISANSATSQALIASPAALNAVPEPTTLSLLGIAAIGLLRRRCRADSGKN